MANGYCLQVLNFQLFLTWFMFKYFAFKAGLLPARELLDINPPISKEEIEGWMKLCDQLEETQHQIILNRVNENLRQQCRQSQKVRHSMERDFSRLVRIRENNKRQERFWRDYTCRDNSIGVKFNEKTDMGTISNLLYGHRWR